MTDQPDILVEATEDERAACAALNPRQKKFAELYAISGNGTQAALDAGYASTYSTAKHQAWMLTTNVNVQTYINYLRRKAGKSLEVTQTRVLAEMARLAFFDIRDLLDEDGNLKRPRDWSDDVAAAVSGMDIGEVVFGDDGAATKLKKIKMASKEKNLEMLAKYLGMFVADKVDPQKEGSEEAQAIVDAIIKRASGQVLSRSVKPGKGRGPGSTSNGNENAGAE